MIGRLGSLFRKYAVVFILLVSGALITSSLVQAYFAVGENAQSLVRIQREKASAAAARIALFVDEIQRQVRSAAEVLPATASAEERRGEYLRLLRLVPAITEVSYLDAAGREELRVSRLAMAAVGSGIDRSREEAFVGAQAGKTYFGRVYFRNESEPYMTIAARQAGPEGGLLAVEVNLKLIWDVISRIKVGQAGYAYVVDDRGQLVAHPDISLVLRKTDLAAQPQVRAALVGRGDDVFVNVNIAPGGERGFLSAHERIDPPGWFVFVEQPAEEAFAPLLELALRSALLLVAGVALAVLASLVLADRMVRPIRVLQAGATRIGAGALDERIEVRTGDELEALADEFNQMTGKLREYYATLEAKVEERTRELSEEREKSERLLLNVLPRTIAERLKAGEEPIADAFPETTVLFADIVDFTGISARVSPEQMVGMLNGVFTEFDRLAAKHGLEKIKTIGDCYMVVGGLPEPRPDHAEAVAEMALEIQEALRPRRAPTGDRLRVRVGINTGPAVAGVIGTAKFAYDLWGDAVNTASRMESHGLPEGIQVTEATYLRLKDKYAFESRGMIDVKGKGPMATYLLLGRLDGRTAPLAAAPAGAGRNRTGPAG